MLKKKINKIITTALIATTLFPVAASASAERCQIVRVGNFDRYGIEDTYYYNKYYRNYGSDVYKVDIVSRPYWDKNADTYVIDLRVELNDGRVIYQTVEDEYYNERYDWGYDYDTAGRKIYWYKTKDGIRRVPVYKYEDDYTYGYDYDIYGNKYYWTRDGKKYYNDYYLNDFERAKKEHKEGNKLVFKINNLVYNDYTDGKSELKHASVAPYIQNDRVYIAVNDIVKPLKGLVMTKAMDKNFTIAVKDKYIIGSMGSTSVKVLDIKNGNNIKTVEMRALPNIVDGKLVLPLASFVEALNADDYIKYDSRTEEIVVYKNMAK